MSTRAIANRDPDDEQDGPAVLLFRAALAPAGSGRKAWTQDSDGEGILSITIPAYAADAFGGQLAWLRERSFRVAIILKDVAAIDLPSEE